MIPQDELPDLNEIINKFPKLRVIKSKYINNSQKIQSIIYSKEAQYDISPSLFSDKDSLMILDIAWNEWVENGTWIRSYYPIINGDNGNHNMLWINLSDGQLVTFDSEDIEGISKGKYNLEKFNSVDDYSSFILRKLSEESNDPNVLDAIKSISKLLNLKL